MPIVRLLHLLVDDIGDPEGLVRGLSEPRILIRPIPDPLPCARIAPSLCSTENESWRVACAVDEVRREEG